MKFFLPWLLILTLSAGCTTRASSVIGPYLPNLVSEKPAIIFIHGFYGSALRKKNMGRRVFLTGKELLFGSSALSLFTAELGTPLSPELEIEGLLGTVPVLPGLYEVDVYSSFVRNLRDSNEKAQILPLVYDWRMDLHLAVLQLDELVKLLLERGAPSISIVAHSMGGQVATYYLGYGAQPAETAKLNWAGARNIQKVVFFGVPFGGSMVSFRSFEKGSGLPKSERMLSADTMSSFPSLYRLLPSLASLKNMNGESISLPLFEIEIWKKHRFGLLRSKEIDSSLMAARERFTDAELGKAKKWNELVQLGRTAEWPAPDHLKVLNVVSSSHDTLDLAYFDATNGKLLFDPDEVEAAGFKIEDLLRTGDGSVSRTSAEVPPAFEAATTIVSSQFSHEKLFLDPDVETKYNEFLAPPKKELEQIERF